MKTIRMGYKAISLFVTALFIMSTHLAWGYTTYTMVTSTSSPSRVIKVYKTQPIHRVHRQVYYQPPSKIVKVYNVYEVIPVPVACPCDGVYSGCRCYADPWKSFERRNISCQHDYIPGHWRDHKYEEYFIEPDTMDDPPDPYGQDVGYDPEDDQCIDKYN